MAEAKTYPSKFTIEPAGKALAGTELNTGYDKEQAENGVWEIQLRVQSRNITTTTNRQQSILDFVESAPGDRGTKS